MLGSQTVKAYVFLLYCLTFDTATEFTQFHARTHGDVEKCVNVRSKILTNNNRMIIMKILYFNILVKRNQVENIFSPIIS